MIKITKPLIIPHHPKMEIILKVETCDRWFNDPEDFWKSESYWNCPFTDSIQVEVWSYDKRLKNPRIGGAFIEIKHKAPHWLWAVHVYQFENCKIATIMLNELFNLFDYMVGGDVGLTVTGGDTNLAAVKLYRGLGFKATANSYETENDGFNIITKKRYVRQYTNLEMIRKAREFNPEYLL